MIVASAAESIVPDVGRTPPWFVACTAATRAEGFHSIGLRSTTGLRPSPQRVQIPDGDHPAISRFGQSDGNAAKCCGWWSGVRNGSDGMLHTDPGSLPRGWQPYPLAPVE